MVGFLRTLGVSTLILIIALACVCCAQVSGINGSPSNNGNLVQSVRVFYDPFSNAHLAPILSRPIGTLIRPQFQGHALVTLRSQGQLDELWMLLHPKDGSDRPAKRHPGVGRFGVECLKIELGGKRPYLRVDENGIVSNGECYYKLSRPAFREVDHMLNDLWYDEHPEMKDVFRRDQLDLTPQQLGR